MITEREIREAAEKLKNNRSPFSDKIRNEMIKASIDTLMPVYEKLFNSILNQGIMPSNNQTTKDIRHCPFCGCNLID